MHTNIIPFPANRPVRPVRFAKTTLGNVISLDRWRARACLRRTSGGVFFVSDVYSAGGGAA